MTPIKSFFFNLHALPLLIFSSYYLLSLILFGSVVINPHDNLELNQVYNHVISKIINGNFESHKIFLSGEFKWHYLDELFYPINIFHLILNNKQFFFFEEILSKIIAYFSFYLFSKYFFNEKIYSILGAIFYASIITNIDSPAPTIFLSFLPYLLYLAITKNQLNFKHIFVIFFIGINSSLVFDYLSLVLMLIFSYFFRNKKNIKFLFIYFIVITLGMIISAIPLIISILSEQTHRIDMMEKNTLSNTLVLELKNLYEIFFPKNIKDLFYLPNNLLKLLILIFSLFLIKKKEISLLLFFIFFTYTFKILLSSDLAQIYFDNFFLILKGFNFHRLSNILPLLYSILLVAILKSIENNYFKKTFVTLIIISSFFLQIYFPINELAKELIRKNFKKVSLELVENNYRNKNFKEVIFLVRDKKNYKYNQINYNIKSFNTFDAYYRFDVYKKIKTIVSSKRVGSLGIDPMIAAMNDINVIDGYHNLYHLEYKKKFKKIIQEELNQNETIKDYYENWGNRVYMYFNDKNNLLLNFQEAKKLGAEYIISTFEIKNKNLSSNFLMFDEDNKIYLYKIL